MNEEHRCPYCNSKKTVKAGMIKLRMQSVQRFMCKSCKKFFTNKKLKFKSYPAAIVLQAISTYNLGYTLEQTKRIISSKFHLSLPLTTLHAWLKIYALALASRTKLAVKDFKAAWFDEKAYYEFFPLHAVYYKTV